MVSKIIINSANLLENIHALRGVLPERYKLIAVIKGNGYGHGLKEIATIIKDEVYGFHVDDVEELIELRTVTNKPAYIFGYVAGNDLEKAMQSSCVLSVFDEDRLKLIDEMAEKLGIIQNVHVKIDALVGRLGIFPDEVPAFIEKLKSFKNIRVSGLYSHFTAHKDKIDYEHTKKQIELFKSSYELFTQAGYTDLEVHMSSSAGLFIPEIVNNPLFNTVRVGKSMYGMWPSKELEQRVALKPVLSWISQIAQVKRFPKDYPIGYTATYKTSDDVIAAVIPQGYSDGYDKKVSYEGEVLIGDQRCRIIGKVAMSMFLADVTHIPNPKQGDEVVLIGKQASEEIALRELGQKMDATSCEVLSKISPLLPREII